MAVAVGDWDEESDVSKRVLVGLQARSTDNEIRFSVLSPEDSPWPRTELLGAMLSRAEALVHPILKDVFAAAEHIVRCDPRIAYFLDR
jgi:hypothetical protein